MAVQLTTRTDFASILILVCHKVYFVSSSVFLLLLFFWRGGGVGEGGGGEGMAQGRGGWGSGWVYVSLCGKLCRQSLTRILFRPVACLSISEVYM